MTFNTREFEGAPESLIKYLKNSQDFQRPINKGPKWLGGDRVTNIRRLWLEEVESSFLDLSKILLDGNGYATVVADGYSVCDKFLVNSITMTTRPVTLLPFTAIPLAAAETWHEGFGKGEPIGTHPTDTRPADRIRTMRDGRGPVRRWWYWSVYRRWFPEPYEEPEPWPGLPAESSLSTFAVSIIKSEDPILVLASDFRTTPGEVVFFVRMLDGDSRYHYNHVRVSRNIVTQDSEGTPVVEIVPEPEDQELWARARGLSANHGGGNG